MSEDLQAEVIAVCRKHKEQNSRNYDYRACVFVGVDYFVKYGAAKNLEPELATQEYLFHHAQQSQTPETPRIAKIVHHFVYQKTPDLATRIQGAIEWLSKVPPPSNPRRHYSLPHHYHLRHHLPVV